MSYVLFLVDDATTLYIARQIFNPCSSTHLWHYLILYKTASVCLKLLTELVEPVLLIASWISHTSHRKSSLCIAIKERVTSPPCMLFPHLIARWGTLTLNYLMCKIKKVFLFCFLSLKVLYYFTFRFVALENHEQWIGKSLIYVQLLCRVNSVLPELKEFSRSWIRAGVLV